MEKPGVTHSKSMSQLNSNFSGGANQLKPSRGGRKKSICGLQGWCPRRVLLLILIIEAPQRDVKHFLGVWLKNVCDGKRKSSTPADRSFLFVLLIPLFSYL